MLRHSPNANQGIAPAIPTGSGRIGGPDCTIAGDEIGAGQCAAPAHGDSIPSDELHRRDKLHEDTSPDQAYAVYSWTRAPQLSIAVTEALSANSGRRPSILQQFRQS